LDRKASQNASLTVMTRSQKNAVDAFANGLEIAIFVTDTRGHIVYANRYAQNLFGFENPQGRSILAVTLSVELEQQVLQATTGESPSEVEITFSFPQERICVARAWKTEADEEQVYVSLVVITELRRMERVRKDFVANVSHEIRTPMTVIRAYAETLLDDGDDADMRAKFLPRIIGEVDRLTSITHDLLILSTSESNPVRKSAADMAEIVSYSVNLFEPQATEKGLTMHYEGPSKLEAQVNASQMTQVVVNLIENAIKYTNEGGLEVKLSSSDSEIFFEVSDTGIGIPEDHLPRLFERFYRVDKARSREGGGTGLGLSIVKHIVEAHGGTVTVTSSLNQGSTFRIALPKQ
jgi:two-component system, OmpR family, phosphate regulon sensor histidine kinase PhoR